jgi:hypothetical protein
MSVSAAILLRGILSDDRRRLIVMQVFTDEVVRITSRNVLLCSASRAVVITITASRGAKRVFSEVQSPQEFSA